MRAPVERPAEAKPAPPTRPLPPPAPVSAREAADLGVAAERVPEVLRRQREAEAVTARAAERQPQRPSPILEEPPPPPQGFVLEQKKVAKAPSAREGGFAEIPEGMHANPVFSLRFWEKADAAIRPFTEKIDMAIGRAVGKLPVSIRKWLREDPEPSRSSRKPGERWASGRTKPKVCCGWFCERTPRPKSWRWPTALLVAYLKT